jgi:hypothetical protein
MQEEDKVREDLSKIGSPYGIIVCVILLSIVNRDKADA